jgi:hypothetical protein
MIQVILRECNSLKTMSNLVMIQARKKDFKVYFKVHGLNQGLKLCNEVKGYGYGFCTGG